MKPFTDMSESEREAFVVFRQYATDRDYMTSGDLAALDADYNFGDLELLQKLIDDDANKFISFEEFHRFWSHEDKYKSFVGEKIVTLRSLLAKFHHLDLDHDDQIDLKELTKFCAATGYNGRPEDIIKKYDINGTGKLGFEEFLKWCKVSY
mmetsp:Transcript_6897/g.16855  ORF Transcript_6897/g.16855 Transcript_6897/m.16855 type:complete len:151 (+) Transcript_6897:99-551(+)|eukprot:CAMPEP_0174892328 /NCGR_PEP_ID=MMETSP0167-20121228/7293_1 /TAXON_ID=38298 /ORGANISM="Rhodella maculata, Strain CCMP736" /LENGTH=150 /DNA_ID=CAMNT_0016130783 /DNA_START=23 /DNA_END=475 /DNA_ORIENTATION=-